MTAPRALWVTNDFPPRSGGIEQFIANLLARTDPDSVRVLTATHPAAVAFDEQLAYRVERIAPRPLLPMPWLASRIRSEAADHGAEVVVFGAAWPLSEVSGATPLPAVALTHGHEAGMTRIGGGPVLRHAMRDLEAIGVISGFTQRYLQKWVPATTGVHRIPPGVDVERFTPDVSGAAIRRRFGLAPDQPLVLCLSRLVARKGQDVLIEAWPAVLRRVPEAQLLIAGSGPMGPALRRRATKLRLNANITFAGDLAWPDLPAFHAAADLFVMPCRTRSLGLDVEGLGIVYLEAQATGTAVIAGDSGGAPEALVAGETGLVVDGRDVRGVGAAVAELLADPQRRLEMGIAGREFVKKHYAWDVIAARFNLLLEQLADRGPK
jgi:phosphatidyl-myo-inositol dimannoside synthase